MANTRISALPAASTPLAGTETLPVVQGGITEQVSVANLTAGRAVSASSMTLTTALATTSGGTGSTSVFVANAIPYASSTTVLATSANLTYNGTDVYMAGKLGIGTTSPANSLNVVAANVAGTDNIGNIYIRTNDSYAAADVGGKLTMGGYYNATSTYAFAGIAGRKENATINNVAGYLQLSTTTSGGALTERVRISSTGGVSIGNTTDPGATNLYITGKTNIGATGSSGKLTVSTDTTGTYYVADFIDTASGSTQYKSVRFIRGSTEVGSIQTTNVATAYVTSSDYRLKENVQPMSDGLQKVLALSPVTYDWKSGGSGQGFIAHELQEIVPDCVTGSKDATEEEEYEITPAVKDENEIEITPPIMGIRTVPVYQGIDTSFLVATLVAAIKEQQTTINDLTNRVEILEKK